MRSITEFKKKRSGYWGSRVESSLRPSFGPDIDKWLVGVDKMNMAHSQFTSWDRILMVFSVVGIVLLGIILSKEDLIVKWVLQESPAGDPIGEIVQVKNDVRKRMGKSFLWNKTKRNDSVYELDSLFTGADSNLQLRLKSGEKINLGSNTVVVLRTQKNESVIDIKIGAISARPDSAPVKIFNDGEITSIRPDPKKEPIVIRRAKRKKLEIETLVGKAELEINGKKTVVEPKEVLKIESVKELVKVRLPDLPVQIVSPKQEEKYWVKSGDSIDVVWKDQSSTKSYELQASLSPQFDEILFSQQTSETKLRWKIEPQPLRVYVRIRNADSKKVLSEITSFEYSIRNAVQIVSPQENAHDFNDVRYFKDKLPPILVEWSPQALNVEYRVEVSKDSNFTQIEQEFKTRSNSFSLNLSRGYHYVRVGFKDDLNQDYLSLPRGFRMGPSDPELTLADKPQLVQKVQKVVLKYRAIEIRTPAQVEQALLNPPQFTWLPLSAASTYRFELAVSRDFAQPKIISGLQKPDYIWSQVKPGQYFWRVRARDKDGNWSSYSEIGELEVEHEAPQVNPIEVKTILAKNINDLEKPIEKTVSWKGIPGVLDYRIDVNDQNQIIRGLSSVVNLRPNIVNEVKVFAVNDQKRRVSQIGQQSVSFRKKLEVARPILLQPADQTTIVGFKTGSSGQTIFRWRAAELTQKHEIQISSSSDFSKLIFQEETSQDVFLLKGVSLSGIVYWRVRSKIGKFVSDWSEPFTLELQVSQ